MRFFGFMMGAIMPDIAKFRMILLKSRGRFCDFALPLFFVLLVYILM
jgi:hypothetical protein